MKKHAAHSFQKTMRYALAVCTIIVIGFASSRPAMMGFYDATRSKQRTLSEESQKVMEQLSGPMTITTYVNIFDKEFDVASPREQKEDMARFKMYTFQTRDKNGVCLLLLYTERQRPLSPISE